MLLHQAAHCAVRHLVPRVAPILLLHHDAARGAAIIPRLLLDDWVARRVLVAGQLGSEDGGEDGGEGGLPLLEAGGPRYLAIGLGQQICQGRAGQRVEIGLGRGHTDIVDAVGL